MMSITASEVEVILHTIKLNVGQMDGRKNGWNCNCAIVNARLLLRQEHCNAELNYSMSEIQGVSCTYMSIRSRSCVVGKMWEPKKTQEKL